jgi:hypothetical protein
MSIPTPPEHPAPPTGRAGTAVAHPATCTTGVVIRWVGWHLLELVGVGVPLALALTVSLWWVLLAALVGALWAVHEIRLARHTRPTPAHPATAGPTTNTTERDREASACWPPTDTTPGSSTTCTNPTQ